MSTSVRPSRNDITYILITEHKIISSNPAAGNATLTDGVEVQFAVCRAFYVIRIKWTYNRTDDAFARSLVVLFCGWFYNLWQLFKKICIFIVNYGVPKYLSLSAGGLCEEVWGQNDYLYTMGLRINNKALIFFMETNPYYFSRID